MSDSTSILDLPTDPVGGGNVSNNISMAATENVVVSQNQLSTQQLNGNLDETTISQIVSGLQTASRNGSTQLPSRDISMNTTGITTDPYIQTNYVPPPQQNVDYIRNYEQTTDMIDDYNKNMRNNVTKCMMQSALRNNRVLGSVASRTYLADIGLDSTSI